MSVPIDNNISVKEYNKISKYKYQQIKTEILHLKTTTVPMIVEALGMTKKRTDEQNIWQA